MKRVLSGVIELHGITLAIRQSTWSQLYGFEEREELLEIDVAVASAGAIPSSPRWSAPFEFVAACPRSSGTSTGRSLANAGALFNCVARGPKSTSKVNCCQAKRRRQACCDDYTIYRGNRCR